MQFLALNKAAVLMVKTDTEPDQIAVDAGHPSTILLTGATGFLGRNLLKQLVIEGHQVVVLKRPTSQMTDFVEYKDQVCEITLGEGDLERVFARPIDIVIHCATNYGRSEPDPMSVLEANLILPLRILQYASRSGTRCFINTDTILDKRISHYSLSKSQFNDWLKAHSRDMACVNVALEHFYGPLDNPSKFVTQIVSSLLRQVDRIPLTPGEQRRDFVFIDDVIDAFLRILQGSARIGPGYHRYEIGTGTTVAIKDFVRLAKELTGNQGTVLDFGALPYRENELMESRVDLARVLQLGWAPKVGLIEGLKLTIESERTRLSA